MLTGIFVGALALFPIFKGLHPLRNPELETAAQIESRRRCRRSATCGFQFDPLGQAKRRTDCDKAKALLSRIGIPVLECLVARSRPAPVENRRRLALWI